MKVRLAFGQTSDEGFLVLAELVRRFPSDSQVHVAFAIYDHEDTFLCQIVEADLHEKDLRDLVASVLLTISQPVYASRWTEVELSENQWATLGLSRDYPETLVPNTQRHRSLEEESLFGLGIDAEQIGEVLLHAPTPLTVLSGPEHRMAFADGPYLRIMGYAQAEEILGKTIREILPELEGQPFFRLLDEVYRTGKPYVGKEVKALLRSPDRGDLEETYFDFVYHPLRDGYDEVVGIMIQAADVTARVLSRTVSQHREELLYSQWAELEAIYRHSPVGMCLIDVETSRILRINQTQAELMGSTVDLLMGKQVDQVASSIPDFARLVKLVTVNKSIRNTVVQAHGEPGSLDGRNWLVNMTPALDGVGALKTISSIFMEMPRTALPESGLETSNDLVGDVLENMTDGVYVLDRDWNFVYLNSHAKNFLRESGDLLGRNLWEAFPAALDTLVKPNFYRTMEQRTATSFVDFYPEPLMIWSDVKVYPSRHGIAVFFRDITGQKAKQEALRESEERYRMMLDLNPQMPLTMSADGLLTDIGLAWTEFTGQSREDALGFGFLKMIYPADVESVAAHIEQALSAEEPFDNICRIQKKNGEYCWMRSRGTPVRGEDKKVLRWYGITEDIDELIRMRQEVAKRAETASRVRRRL